MRKYLVFVEYSGVFLVVYGIIGFFPFFEIIRIFVGNDGRRLLAEFKMLMLDNACVRGIAVGIVDYSISLEIVNVVEMFMLEMKAAIFQITVSIVEIFVNATCI